MWIKVWLNKNCHHKDLVVDEILKIFTVRPKYVVKYFFWYSKCYQLFLFLMKPVTEQKKERGRKIESDNGRRERERNF